jgi:flagellar basal-body rod protein FlgF/flagellar basal-body rod protein FlgG
VREGNSKADSQRGKLRLVSFANPRQLQKDGNGTFNYAGNDAPVEAKTATIAQGSLEKSNVRAVVEMSRMIEITRSYTQIAAMLQQQSDLGQSSIDKLADVPN